MLLHPPSTHHSWHQRSRTTGVLRYQREIIDPSLFPKHLHSKTCRTIRSSQGSVTAEMRMKKRSCRTWLWDQIWWDQAHWLSTGCLCSGLGRGEKGWKQYQGCQTETTPIRQLRNQNFIFSCLWFKNQTKWGMSWETKYAILRIKGRFQGFWQN